MKGQKNMDSLPVVDESAVMARELLQGLYALGAETVHAITCADGVTVKVELSGGGGSREVALPAGSYIVARVVAPPTDHAGLFGVRAPRPAAV
jgi:hypothetical protein